MQRKIPAQEINVPQIKGLSLDSEAQTVYTVNGDNSHLENPIAVSYTHLQRIRIIYKRRY